MRDIDIMASALCEWVKEDKKHGRDVSISVLILAEELQAALSAAAASCGEQEKNPTIKSLEDSLIAQEEAARHFFNKYVALRKVVFDAVQQLDKINWSPLGSTLPTLNRLKEALK